MWDDLSLMTAAQERAASKEKKIISLERQPPAAEKAPSAFPKKAEEAEYLRQKMERQQTEKVLLTRKLKSSEKKLSELQQALQEKHEYLDTGGEGSTQKIVELSKKNRALHAELTTERNRSRQLMKQLTETTEALASQNQQANEQKRNVPALKRNSIKEDGSVKELHSKITSLEEQLAQTKEKISTYRNQCQILKQDMKLAHKVLEQEVGTAVNVKTLLDNRSGWRGRSQQIISLQSKVAELKCCLERAEGPNETSMVTSQGDKEKRQLLRVESRQKAVLEKMEREKKQSLEGIRLELEVARAEVMTAVQERNALRARNKTLNRDIKQLRKKQQSSVLEATECIDIVGLECYRSSSDCVGRPEVLDSAKQELEQENTLLRKELKKYKMALSKKPVQHCQQEAWKRPTKSEIPSLPHIALPTTKLLTGRMRPLLTREIQSAGEPVMEYSKYSLREAQVLAQVANAEVDRLLELTSSLQQQLDSATDQLMKLRSEKQAKQQRQPTFPSTASKQGSRVQSRGNEKTEDLATQLAIQLDENTVLKETLQQLRQERREDANKFHIMLQEAKLDSMQKIGSNK